MSRIARLQHTILTAIAAGEGRNKGALDSFNAGVGHIIASNREATDAEMLALENLADQVLWEPPVAAEEPASGGEVSVPSLAPSSPSEDSLSPVEAEPETAGDAVAQGGEASEAEVTQPPAGEAPASEAPAGAPMSEVPEALTPLNSGELGLTETVTPPPISGEALFDDESAAGDEDDGA
jgi:hypothetical protein